jgi:hypothetical protein
VRDILNDTYHDQWIGRGGPTARPCQPDLNPLDFYLWGHLETLVYAASVDNEEAFHHCIVDACQAVSSYPSIFEQTQESMVRYVKVCIYSHGGHFEYLL